MLPSRKAKCPPQRGATRQTLGFAATSCILWGSMLSALQGSSQRGHSNPDQGRQSFQHPRPTNLGMLTSNGILPRKGSS